MLKALSFSVSGESQDRLFLMQSSTTINVAKSKITQKRLFNPIHAIEPETRTFAFNVMNDALLLYALRSKIKPIFPSHVRSAQNQYFELSQILSR